MESETSQIKRHYLRTMMQSKTSQIKQYYLRSNNDGELDNPDKAALFEDQ